MLRSRAEERSQREPGLYPMGNNKNWEFVPGTAVEISFCVAKFVSKRQSQKCRKKTSNCRGIEMYHSAIREGK